MLSALGVIVNKRWKKVWNNQIFGSIV